MSAIGWSEEKCERMRERAEKAEARVAELTEIATRAINLYDGAHSTTCHVFEEGLTDDEIAEALGDRELNGGCDCGATKSRDELRTRLGPLHCTPTSHCSPCGAGLECERTTDSVCVEQEKKR